MSEVPSYERGRLSYERGPLSYERGRLSHERGLLSPVDVHPPPRSVVEVYEISVESFRRGAPPFPTGVGALHNRVGIFGYCVTVQSHKSVV